MFETLLGVLTPIVDPTTRFALEQLLSRQVQFMAEVSDLDRRQYAYKGRRIYRVFARVVITGDLDIALVSATDACGNGLIFFPAQVESAALPSTPANCGPNVLGPKAGTLSSDDFRASEKDFTLFVATDKPLPIGHVDVRYAVMDKRRTIRRALLRLPLHGND